MGEKVSMSDELNQRLRIAGLAHIVVASGYALSVIVGLAKKYLKTVSRFAVFAGSLITVVAFIYIAGFSPSLLRAGLAVLLSLFFWYYGRRLHPVRLLAYVASLSVILSPEKFFSVGCQLSFASYAGILLILPVLSRYYYQHRAPGYFATMVLVSISAQLSCLPLSLYYFGSFAVLGILSNILVTPFIPIVMMLSFALSLRLSLFLLIFILEKILWLQLFVVDWISDIPWSIFQLESGKVIYLAIYLPILLLILLVKWHTKYDYRPRYTLDKSQEYGKIFLC